MKLFLFHPSQYFQRGKYISKVLGCKFAPCFVVLKNQEDKMIKNEDLEKMILRELVLTPVLEFIVDKFVEELLKEDEIEIMAPLKTPKPHDEIYANSEKETNSSKTPCVGSYPVSGYTRSDGTEVSAYTRTCGAKHLPNEKENKNNSINTNYNTPFELKVEYNQTLPEYNQVDTKSVSEKYQGLNLGQMALKIMSKLFVNK